MSRNQVSAPMTGPEFYRLLAEAAAALETPFAVDEVASESLRRFCELMLKWNASLNITGARTVADLAESHLPDAIVLAHFVPHNAVLVDVGSGGGLPAIPLAILRPDVQMSLIEPRAKRVAFLRTAVRELGLRGVAPWMGRAEDWNPSAAPQVAVSRATFPPAEWVSVAMSLLRGQGRVYALLSETWQDAQLGGFVVGGRHHYQLRSGLWRTLAWFDGSPVD